MTNEGKIVGFAPGVFDVFHMGHLNILLRAKEHCDLIFKGDDWRGTPKGDQLEAGMAAVGAKVVYFPYTQHVSSTRLRDLINAANSGDPNVETKSSQMPTTSAGEEVPQ